MTDVTGFGLLGHLLEMCCGAGLDAEVEIERVPLLPIAQKLVSRISPVLTYFQTYPLSDDLHYQWALLDTHDALTDWYKHFRTRAQIRATLESLGATAIWCESGGNGIEARAQRPI